MERKPYSSHAWLLFTGFVLLCRGLGAQGSYDSLNVKPPKHYFNTVFMVDGYNRRTTKLDTAGDAISRRLKSYGVKQFNLSFYVPIFTRDIRGTGADSNVTENVHLLLTGNFLSMRPVFDGITQHTLTRRSIGCRFIYNTGKKGVWFIEAAPFVTRDITYRSKPVFRLASTVIYSHNVSDRFNWRLGITKSFQWGNRLYLPFIGLRVGRLDKVNFSLQFPRNVSLNIPCNSNITVSVFSRAQGGVFNFSNHDTLYSRPADMTFHFTRYEINTGLRLDARLGSHFSFFMDAGLSTKNNITFYSDRANKNRPRLPYNIYFYKKSVAPAGFLQLGFTLRFGKTRSYYNNRNIYDAIDLNNSTETGSNPQIPIPPKKLPKNPNLESIKDLLEYEDF